MNFIEWRPSGEKGLDVQNDTADFYRDDGESIALPAGSLHPAQLPTAQTEPCSFLTRDVKSLVVVSLGPKQEGRHILPAR
jgi:hypothetical protein